MTVDEFIEQHKSKIVDGWKQTAEQRLAINITNAELINDLPEFIDNLVEALRAPAGQWPQMRGARSHGRHRLRIGMDVGGLTEEMVLVSETIIELAEKLGVKLAADEIGRLLHAIGRGAAVSLRAYASLRDAEVEAQAATHFSFIAHEIRTPLHAARLTAGMLMSSPEELRPRQHTRLERSLTQIADLVDNFIVHTRLQGRPKLVRKQVNARELMEMARDDVEMHAKARNIDVQLEVGALEFIADMKLVGSALTNLLRNAIKFSHVGGSVVLRALTREDRVLFEVEDSCGGMPDDLPSKLFQPFVQANTDTSGFGLGLLIVKQAVEAHHGSVRVANRPGEGCSFVIELPVNYVDHDDEGA